jgi:hypothetical protein
VDVSIATPDRNRRPGRGTRWGYSRTVALVVGVFLAASGSWAMIDPRSFFDSVASFEPYNRHFLLDIGAFQIGLAAVLLLAAARPTIDALACALLGVGGGLVAHVGSHVVTRDAGGTPETDIPFFSAVAVLLVTAGMLRWRDTDS